MRRLPWPWLQPCRHPSPITFRIQQLTEADLHTRIALTEESECTREPSSSSVPHHYIHDPQPN